MLHYPNINPVALQLGPVKIYWYGVMYVVGFLAAWALATYRAKKTKQWTSNQVSDMIFYAALGVVVGGRTGYMLFYDLPNFLHNPLIIFKVWDGGMSFHGGLLGVLIAVWLYSRHISRGFFESPDFLAPFIPLGLGAGRIGNFINGELWGRVTECALGHGFSRGRAITTTSITII